MASVHDRGLGNYLLKSRGWRIRRAAVPPLRAMAGSLRRLASEEIDRQQARLALWLPVFMGAGAVWYLSLAAEPSGWIAPLAGLLAGAAAWAVRRTLSLLAPAMALAFLAAGFASADWRTARVTAPVIAKPMSYAMVSGTLLSRTATASGGERLLIAPREVGRLATEDMPARLRITVRTQIESALPGDVIRLPAGLLPPPGPAAPGAFDFSRQAFFREIGAVGYALGKVEVEESWPGGFAACLEFCVSRLRVKLTHRIVDALPAPRGAVAAALMTGDRGGIPEDILQDLRDAGLAHLLAISGLHMALFAGTLFWGVRAALALVPGLALTAPIKKWAAALALAGAAGYLLVSGASVATQRAFVMFALIFIAVLTDRPAITLRNVALAALIILVLTPEAVLEASFQMSFAAAAALVAFYEGARGWVTRLSQAAVERGWVARGALYLGGIALTSIVASLATSPFAAFHFNRVVDFGLVANLAALPLVGFIVMPAALVAFILMPVGLEALPLWVAGQGIHAILWVAHQVASWPGAVSLLPAMPQVTLAATALGGLWMVIWAGRIRWAGVLGPMIGIALAVTAPVPVMLVEREAKLVGLRLPDGTLTLSSSRSGSFSGDVWLRRDADRRGTGEAAGVFSCDGQGCAREHPVLGTVSLARDWQAAMEDCQQADILVTPLYMPRRCAAPLIIDRGVLSRRGAHAVYLEEEVSGDGEQHLRIIAACDLIGDRPWSHCAPRKPWDPGPYFRRKGG